MKRWFHNLCHNLLQLLIVTDQLINVLISCVTGTKAWADETMSARCHRHYVNGSRKWPRNIVNTLFFWQPDHCKEAYESEVLKHHLPPEERKDLDVV